MTTADLYTAACRRVADWRDRGAPAAEAAALVDGLLADLQVVASVADHDSAALYDKLQAADSDLASATALYGVALKRAELAESEAGLRWRERAEAATAAARDMAKFVREMGGHWRTICRRQATCIACPIYPTICYGVEGQREGAVAEALLAKHAEVIR